MSMLTDVALQVGMTGGAAAAGALVNGMFNRRSRKTSDAATISDIALDLIRPVSDELKAVRGELSEVRAEFAAYKTEMAQKDTIRHAAITKHAEWDNQVMEALKSLGHDVSSPPPLNV